MLSASANHVKGKPPEKWSRSRFSAPGLASSRIGVEKRDQWDLCKPDSQISWNLTRRNIIKPIPTMRLAMDQKIGHNPVPV